MREWQAENSETTTTGLRGHGFLDPMKRLKLSCILHEICVHYHLNNMITTIEVVLVYYACVHRAWSLYIETTILTSEIADNSTNVHQLCEWNKNHSNDLRRSGYLPSRSSF